MEKNLSPIIKEVTINAPLEKVWEAITNKDLMKEWYFDLESFSPAAGFEFHFYGGDENKKYLHLCKIKEVIPLKKLSYTWKYEEVKGESLVTFELFPAGDKTKVKLTHEGTESFRTDDPNFAKESFNKGWEYIIKTSLKEYLEKKF